MSENTFPIGTPVNRGGVMFLMKKIKVIWTIAHFTLYQTQGVFQYILFVTEVKKKNAVVMEGSNIKTQTLKHFKLLLKTGNRLGRHL